MDTEYEDLTDINECAKILTETDIRKILLYNEVTHITKNKVSERCEIIKFMEHAFQRYSQLDTCLEDTEWIKHDSTSWKYQLKTNDVIFINTINKVHEYDIQTQRYIDALGAYFKRHIEGGYSAQFGLITRTKDIMMMYCILTKTQNT